MALGWTNRSKTARGRGVHASCPREDGRSMVDRVGGGEISRSSARAIEKNVKTLEGGLFRDCCHMTRRGLNTRFGLILYGIRVGTRLLGPFEPYANRMRMASAWKVARICASRSALPLRVRKQEVPLRVPGGCLTLVVPESEEDVLDLYIESGSLSGDPYWACPWPSAAALAERLALIGKAEFSKREGQVEVADLGAGLGLAGLAAAREGAARVTLLDREPIALRCAMLAAELNGLETSEGDEIMRSSRNAVGIHLLDDSDKGIRSPSMSSGGRVSARIFDWTAPVPAELHASFDVVMACDVLYDKDAAGFVASAVPLLLKEDGLLLLADPPLRTPKHREAFVEYLNKNTRKGNGAFVLEQVCSHHVEFEAREFQVQIMHFRRSNGSTIGIKLT